MKLLLAPHDDDQVLNCAFTCIREKPLVVICTDSYIQPARGEIGCSALERAVETDASCKILGCDVARLALSDATVDESSLVQTLHALLSQHFEYIETVYAPAEQGGNLHHDQVSRAARRVFGDKVIEYTTYSKTELYTTGDVEIVPTEEELRLKKAAMDCHVSQLRINLPHFRAVFGKSEWLIAKGVACDIGREPGETGPPGEGAYLLNLGCGAKVRDGWDNMDLVPRAPGVIPCDVLQGIPAADSVYDVVYTEDFLEHIPQDKAVAVINEIFRVLKPGGIMEHYVPNAGSRNDFGSPSHLSHWNLQCFEHFDVDSYRYEKDRQYEGFVGGFRKVLAELVNWQVEEDGVKRAQSLHVKYEAVK